jgi:hypothetical protein
MINRDPRMQALLWVALYVLVAGVLIYFAGRL